MHGGSVCANYPFDGFEQQSRCQREASVTPDDDVAIDLALTYSINNPEMYNSNSFDNGITNGAEWYCLYGGMQDWNYVWMGDVELTMELSNVKNPAASQLAGFWEDNRESLLAYLEKVHMGVKGRITSAATGEPIVAEITVKGREDFVAYSEETFGDYFRLLLPGTYTVIVTAPGYSSASQTVTVYEGEPTVLDIKL